jgi:hypothetical protein
MIAGIDIGLKGGLTILNPQNHTIITSRLPTIKTKNNIEIIDTDALYNLLNIKDITDIAVERPFLIPTQKGNLAIGGNYYIILSTLNYLDVKVHLVMPKTWQKAFNLKPKSATRLTKAHIRAFINREYNLDFAHDGIADSYLIARYLEKILAAKTD